MMSVYGSAVGGANMLRQSINAARMRVAATARAALARARAARAAAKGKEAERLAAKAGQAEQAAVKPGGKPEASAEPKVAGGGEPGQRVKGLHPAGRDTPQVKASLPAAKGGLKVPGRVQSRIPCLFSGSA